MPIIFDAEKKTFKLDTPNTSYIIHIFEGNYLLNLYYGKSIPETCVPERAFRPRNAGFSPLDPNIAEKQFSPDSSPMEYACHGAGDLRLSALAIENAAGDNVTDMRYVSHKIYAGKPEIPGQPSTYANHNGEADTLEILAYDKVTGIYITLYYTAFSGHDIITRRVRIENRSNAPCVVERAFSLSLDLPDMSYDLLTFYGRHKKERSLARRPLAHGLQGVESLRGVSGHCQNPFFALCSHNADEEHGEAYGFHLVYSGNFSALAECQYNNSTRLLLGINPTDFAWHLAPGTFFDTPEAVMVYSSEGLGEMSRILHRFYNANLIRGKYKTEKRPLLINSWEAAYFDFDSDKLVEFAKEAKQLGIELLVMDDGWFGKRNDDTTSLGDWYVNEEKLPGGLGALIDRVHAEGLKFGIWYEPEMISPDSELFRAHPDWCVHVEGREPKQGRHQYVLDVSRKDVRDNIWQQMYEVLSKNKIDYLKWDFNRNLCDAGSALLPRERKKEFFHRFILGTYDLMQRLTETFPDILFENCSGGGGRFDPAMLAYSPQIWTSDMTDPIERLSIQFGTSFCYPASTMGAHVSASSRTGYATKGNVAMWGTFGYELDPRKLTETERETVKEQVAAYHRTYALIRGGDLYRLISPFDDPFHAAWEIVSPDKKEALFTYVTMQLEFGTQPYLRLRGLDANRYYKNTETGEVFSGAYLMNVGICLSGASLKTGESCTFLLEGLD